MNSTAELKFLLELLGCEGYRAPLSAKCFNKFQAKPKLCKELADRGWVGYSQAIASVKLLPAGKSLLSIDTSNLPLDALTLKILEKVAAKSGKVRPQEISVRDLTADARQTSLQQLADRGFVELTWQMQRQKGEVWLTSEGLEYLREDYHPKGLRQQINLDLVGYYVEFLRKAPNKASSEAVEPIVDLDDAGILDLIKHLDKELGTENYLPMFHLREKLALPRDEFDQALYRLERSDQIELSSLQETDAYTPEQIDSGIPQNIGGPLFFISWI
jgi:hypothetical protein